MWTSETWITAVVGALAGLIVSFAGALIALSNSHTIRSWMDQKGQVKKALADADAKELELRYQKFAEVLQKQAEEINLLKLKIEAVELAATNERREHIGNVAALNGQLVVLAARSASAEAKVSLMDERQKENVVTIEAQGEQIGELTLENRRLWDIINKRGGI